MPQTITSPRQASIQQYKSEIDELFLTPAKSDQHYRKIIQLLNAVGKLYSKNSEQFHQAQTYFEQALTTFDRLGQADYDDKLTRLKTQMKLAQLFQKKGDTPNFESYRDQAFKDAHAEMQAYEGGYLLHSAHQLRCLKSYAEFIAHYEWQFNRNITTTINFYQRAIGYLAAIAEQSLDDRLEELRLANCLMRTQILANLWENIGNGPELPNKPIIVTSKAEREKLLKIYAEYCANWAARYVHNNSLELAIQYYSDAIHYLNNLKTLCDHHLHNRSHYQMHKNSLETTVACRKLSALTAPGLTSANRFAFMPPPSKRSKHLMSVPAVLESESNRFKLVSRN